MVVSVGTKFSGGFQDGVDPGGVGGGVLIVGEAAPQAAAADC